MVRSASRTRCATASTRSGCRFDVEGDASPETLQRARRAGEGPVGCVRHGHERRRGVRRDSGLSAETGACRPRIDTLIIGAGQAGLALSHYLAGAGHEHVLLERGRIGERWHETLGLAHVAVPELDEPAAGRAGARGHRRLPRPPGARRLPRAVTPDRSMPRCVKGVEVERVGAFALRIPRSTRARGPGSHANVVVATGDADVPHVPLPAPRGVPARCTPPSTAARELSRTAGCWSSAPARAGSSSPSSSARRGVTSCSRSAGTRERRAGTAAATSSSGSSCSATSTDDRRAARPRSGKARPAVSA